MGWRQATAWHISTLAFKIESHGRTHQKKAETKEAEAEIGDFIMPFGYCAQYEPRTRRETKSEYRWRKKEEKRDPYGIHKQAPQSWWRKP